MKTGIKMKETVLPGILTALLLLGGFLALSNGPWEISPDRVVRIILARIGLFDGIIDPVEAAIIWDGRMPRLITGFLVGFSLAAAGCVMQGIFKNPMASPGVIGVSSGAALGAVGAIYSGMVSRSLWVLPLSAVLCAMFTLGVVFAIATSGGRTSVSTLLLAGIALNMVLGALTSFVITLGTREFEVGRVIVNWLMGDLNDRSWEHVWVVSVTAGLGTLGAAFFLKDLNIIMIDDETAANLGVNVGLARTGLLIFASLQTGGAIAVAGVIGFVGLIAPHMIRGLIGPDNRKLIPLAGLLGGLFVIYADLFVRLILEVDLKVGILTSLMGGPFFLWLLVTYRRRFDYL